MRLESVIGRLRTGTVTFPLALLSCVPIDAPPVVSRPEPPGDLAVTANTDTPDVFEGTAVTLTAEATAGILPYLFRWDLNGGPEELILTGATSQTLATDPLTTPGRYVFRVVVTDNQGSHATDFIAVEVGQAVEADAPGLAVVGEPTPLSATIEAPSEGVALTWEVVRGTASLDDATSTNPTLTTTTGETVEVLLTVTLAPSGASPVTTTRSFEIVSVHDLRPRVLVETNLGDFTIELDGEAAPLHTANFLLYVDDGFYEGLLFHRNACTNDPDTDACEPFVLQGGGYRRVDDELEAQEPTREPVSSEADNGLSNGTLYSVSLALSGTDADSGTTEFFINLDDNGFLDDQSFTVFGNVVDGTDVIDAIAASERTDSPIIPGEVSLPVEDVIIQGIIRVAP
jgi:cyclophilin family peptidyl-prolyl cis-trans isomerase